MSAPLEVALRRNRLLLRATPCAVGLVGSRRCRPGLLLRERWTSFPMGPVLVASGPGSW